MAVNYTLSPSPWFEFTYPNGSPVIGGQLFTYLAGTTTPATTYRTSNGTPQTNPIILDGFGAAVIFLAPGSYFFALYDSVANGGALIRTQDNISAVPVVAAQTAVMGEAGETLNGGAVVYLSAGSGGKTAGLWYNAKADNAYSSTLPQLGFISTPILSGAVGSINLIGSLTGVSVTVGSSYFVDAVTAGNITATAPANSRYVGQADTGSSLVFAADPPPQLQTVSNDVCDGRVSLTTGVPVTPTDVTAATTVYFMPYRGNRIALYNGSQWIIDLLAQISIAVPATTASIYDVFVYDNAGTPTLELSIAWTSDTAIFAAGTYASTRPTQDGVYVKSTNGTVIDATRRYVGTFRTTGVSGQTEDSAKKRYVWNFYNRVVRTLQAPLETTASWAYTTATWRQANANAASQLDVVIGMPEVTVTATVNAIGSNNPGSNEFFAGIGADSTSALATGCLPGSIESGNSVIGSFMASYVTVPAIGRHFYAQLEQSTASGTTTWYGQNGAATTYQSGINGLLSGS